jgi:hypothetical protein
MRYRLLGCALVMFATSLLFVGSQRPPSQVMQATTDNSNLNITPVNNGITFKISVNEKNIFRDALYAYYVKIYTVDGPPIWEHIYDLQSAKKNKLTTITLNLQKINLPSGEYKVYAELREDAFEEDMNGNILKPHHVVWAKTSNIIEVK